jgi:hypothetical protein
MGKNQRNSELRWWASNHSSMNEYDEYLLYGARKRGRPDTTLQQRNWNTLQSKRKLLRLHTEMRKTQAELAESKNLPETVGYARKADGSDANW